MRPDAFLEFLKMGKRSHFRQIQGGTHSAFNAYEILQDAIAAQENIKCTVVVTPDHISIRTKDYADFLLAKNVIKGRVTVPIIRG